MPSRRCTPSAFHLIDFNPRQPRLVEMIGDACKCVAATSYLLELQCQLFGAERHAHVDDATASNEP